MSTVAENLQRLQTAKTNIATAIKSKGVTVNSTYGLEKFPTLISNIGGTINSPDLTYNKIANIVRSGNAENVFRIGDQITTVYTDTNGNRYNMPWDVVAFRQVELETGSKVPGMIIQSHYATVESITFDAAEPSTSSSTIKSHGDGRWMYSGIRQWLNSNANKGSWWKSTHTGDVAPTQLSSINGFMKGLPTDFVNMLKKTKRETARSYAYPMSLNETVYNYDITYDTFFLPSVREEHCQYSQEPTTWDGSDREGTDWEYWIQRKGDTPQDLGSAYTNTNAIRYSLIDKTTPKTVWMRSISRKIPSAAFYLYKTGYFSHNYVNDTYTCAAPACVIC